MKILAFFACAAVAASAFADEAMAGKARSPEEVAARKEAIYRNTGGFVRKPGSNAGKVAFIDAQGRFSRAEIEASARNIGGTYRIDVVVVEGKADGIAGAVAAAKRAGGATSVVVASLDPAMPALVVLPDERCAIVNVAAFPAECDAGLLRKQVARGFAAVSGAMSSQADPSLMSAFDNPRKLAAFPAEAIPADVGVRVKNALRSMGVTPYLVATYKRACQEGWAPAPTNDVQKAIWDKVHAIPTEPIKIKYDKK